ncbi:MAG: Spy/CpxP family protein refolding chaperone [Rhodanobacter thiooxydans]|nr:Spy/CpxP family protein refolding chaperone [Rhodanobacter thiooxydans]
MAQNPRQRWESSHPDRSLQVSVTRFGCNLNPGLENAEKPRILQIVTAVAQRVYSSRRHWLRCRSIPANQRSQIMNHPNAVTARPLQAATSRGRWLAALTAAGALAGLVAVIPQASADAGEQRAPHAMKTAAHHDHGQMEKRMAERVERVFSKVGATDEQKARARVIVEASAEQMKAMRPADGSGPKDMLALLSAESIDRDRIEQLRAARHAQMDERSKLMTRTLADLAEVLTPEQRKDAAKSLARMGGGHPHHGKRHGHGDGPRAADGAVRS